MIDQVLKSIENTGLLVPKLHWCKNVYVGEHVIHLTDDRSTYKRVCIHLTPNLKKIEKIGIEHYHVEYEISKNRKHHKKIRSHHKMKSYMFYDHYYKINNGYLEVEGKHKIIQNNSNKFEPMFEKMKISKLNSKFKHIVNDLKKSPSYNHFYHIFNEFDLGNVSLTYNGYKDPDYKKGNKKSLKLSKKYKGIRSKESKKKY